MEDAERSFDTLHFHRFPVVSQSSELATSLLFLLFFILIWFNSFNSNLTLNSVWRKAAERCRGCLGVKESSKMLCGFWFRGFLAILWEFFRIFLNFSSFFKEFFRIVIDFGRIFRIFQDFLGFLKGFSLNFEEILRNFEDFF